LARKSTWRATQSEHFISFALATEKLMGNASDAPALPGSSLREASGLDFDNNNHESMRWQNS
jgi:hypothetical protein